MGSGSGQIDYSYSDFNGLGAFEDYALDHIVLNGVQETCGKGSCTGSLGGNGQPNLTMPITLGQSFALHMDLLNEAFSTELNGSASGGGTLQLAFRVVDANGNPVQVYFAPEPGSIMLVGCGIAAALLFRRRKNNA
jgi:hypothetical protein